MRCLAPAVLIPFLGILLLPLPEPSEAGATPSSRLARDVVPTFERVSLTLDPREDRYSGRVRISLRVDASTDSFRFHAEEMDLRELSLTGPGGAVGTRWRTGARGLVTVTAAPPLQRGAYTLSIGFENDFDKRTAGLYRLTTGGKDYAFTQFEADDARRAFPCWDEPSFKIPYQFVLTIPSGDLAVTNTLPERTTPAGDSKTITFRRTKPVPSYGLAIAAGPLETVPIPGLPVPGRVVFPQGDPRLTEIAVRMTPPLLSALTRYFGRPYPYEKLDLIAVPEFWPGGMENPGAITFRDDALLLDPASASVGARSQLARYLAHEMAHMWFGDLVTMKWWDDLWLNESFAEWMGDKIADQIYPELRVGTGILFQREAAFATDSKLSTRAIRQPVDALDNLLQAADELAYFKGQAILAMFERWIGPESFRRGVNEYLTAHAWGNAEAADLWSALSEASGKDVDGALGTFLDQGGVPLVTARVLPGGGLELTQTRFLDYGLTAPAQTWKIPVTLRYSAGGEVRTRSVLLDRPAMTVALDGSGPVEWIHSNAGEKGYYRWDVGESMLERLAEHKGELDVRERMGAVMNAGGLLHAGVLHGDAYMRLLGRFADDSDPQVVSAVVGELDVVQTTFVTPDLEEPFARFLRATLGPPLRRFGLVRRTGEEEAVSLLRPRLLGLLGDAGRDSAVLAFADSIADRCLSDPESVDGSIKGVALRLSAMHGDAARFDTYRERFETARAPTDRGLSLSALGCFRDSTLVARALAYSLSGPLRPQEQFSIPSGIAALSSRRDLLWKWIQAHYAEFTARIPAMYSVYMPYFAGYCCPERLEEAKRFFADPKHQAPGTEREVAKVADMVSDCASLRAREGAAVSKFLRRTGGGP
jgi:alanyl aminopeptidase